jgi:putative protein kinase ArgK-like GTPase of G3E family
MLETNGISQSQYKILEILEILVIARLGASWSINKRGIMVMPKKGEEVKLG